VKAGNQQPIIGSICERVALMADSTKAGLIVSVVNQNYLKVTNYNKMSLKMRDNRSN